MTNLRSKRRVLILTAALIISLILQLGMPGTIFATGVANENEVTNSVTQEESETSSISEIEQEQSYGVSTEHQETDQSETISETKETQIETSESINQTTETQGSEVAVTETSSSTEETQEVLDPVTLLFEEGGLTVEVTGGPGVIPSDAILNVVGVADEEGETLLDILMANTDLTIETATLLDITIIDSSGNVVQPNGTVTVTIKGLHFINEGDETFVYHIDSADVQENQNGMQMMSSVSPDVEEFPSESTEGEVSFETDHFSIYIVGTNIRHENSNNRYQMFVGDTVVLEERDDYSFWYGFSSSNSSVVTVSGSGDQVTATAVGFGTASVMYRTGGFLNPTYNYFYLEVVPSSIDTIVPAPEPAPDPSGLPQGTVTASKDATWVDYPNRIAEIVLTVEGIPKVMGSDVILVMDTSGSMDDFNRIDMAQQSSVEFIHQLLANNNEDGNRVAFIPFSYGPQSGGSGSNEVAIATDGSHNFTTDIQALHSFVNQTSADGGTNYTAALQKALNYANSRPAGERNRPLYVVFLSDGAPGRTGNSTYDTAWNGVIQANSLKNTHDATIYAVGIQLTGSAPTAMNQIASPGTNGPLYANVNDLNDLGPVLTEIAGEIKIAGTQAYFTDYLSEFYDFLPSFGTETSDGTYDTGDRSVTIQIGNITATSKEYKIFVQLKDEYRNTDASYPTNSNVYLDYTDADSLPGHKQREEIGHPSLSVGFGTIDIEYVLVNEAGQYITPDGTVVTEPFKVVVATEPHLVNGSPNLDLDPTSGSTYSVPANPPSGYALHSGETTPKDQTITSNNSNATVEYKVVRSVIDFSFTKVDAQGNPLMGSAFTLEKDGTSYSNTGTDPEFIFADLGTGTYVLTETVVPSGFNEPTGTWTIVVEVDVVTGLLVVRIPAGDEYLTGTNGQFTLKNEPIEADPDQPLIRVSKTFSGLTQAQINQLVDFKITIASSVATIMPQDLYLTDVTPVGPDANGNITYNWEIEGFPAGTYTVTESGEELPGYTVVVENDGTITITAAEIVWNQALNKKPNTQVDNDLRINGVSANVVATKLTQSGGVLVWTAERMSASQRLAIVGEMNSQYNELGLTINNSFWFSGDDIAGSDFYFLGHPIQYDYLTGNLHIPYPNQWSMIIYGTYDFEGGEPADIAVTNTYRRSTIDFSFTKVSPNGVLLNGSEFTLEKVNADGTRTTINSITSDPLFTYESLEPGSYELTETKAPEGFQLPTDNVWKFDVVENSVTGDLEIIFAAGDELDTDQNDQYILVNTPQTAFPQTGGFGTIAYTLIGTFIIVLSAGLYINKNKKITIKGELQ